MPEFLIKYKKMKKILFPLLLLFVSGFLFQSCEDEVDLAPDTPDLFSTEGAVVSPGAPSPDFFDTSEPDAPVTFDLSTIGEEVNSVRVLKSLNSGGEIEHAVVSSFPTTFSVSLQEAVDGTGQSVSDLKVGDKFVFSFEATTPSGTYVTGKTISLSVSCSTKLPGTYEYTSTNTFCDSGPITGEVEIIETEPGVYVFDDFSFGVYNVCYDGFSPASWGSLQIVRYTDTDNCDECSQTEACNAFLIEGEDAYGDTWTMTVDDISGSQLTLSWSNTYGEFGTAVLNRPDGSTWPPLD